MLTIPLPLGHTGIRALFTPLPEHGAMHFSTWPGWALAAYITGVLVAQAGHPTQLALAVAAFCGVGLLSPRLRGPSLVLALALAGGGLRHAATVGRDPWRDLDGLRVDATGTVLGQVRARDHSLSFLFRVDRIEGRPELPGGRVWAVWHADRADQPEPLSGERWRLSARLGAPRGADYPGGFDQRLWLARHGIHHELHGSDRRDTMTRLAPAHGPAWGLRARILERLAVGLTPRQHGLLCGVVLGETQFLAPEDEESFRATGTSHLLAASGLNVALMVFLVAWLGRRCGYGPGRTALPALAVALFYTLLAEASPSVVRAAAMATASLLAMYTGRVSSVLHSLTLACLGCVVLDPAYLYDLGFQMSVLAVLSLLFLQPGVAARLEGLPGWLVPPLSATLSATLGLLPWMLWNFQQCAPATIVANLLMGWAAEALLPLGMLQATLRWLAPPAAALLTRLNAVLLSYLLSTATFLAGWFGPGQLARPDRCQLAGLCILLALVAGWLYRRVDFRWLLLGDLLLALLWLPAPRPSQLRVRVAFPGGHPLAWVRTRQADLLLAPEQALRSGQRMLTVNGAWPTHLLDVDRPWQGQLLDGRPGSCRLRYGRCTLLLAWTAPPREHQCAVDVLVADRRYVDCQVWVHPPHAQEITSDGRSISVSLWQENPARARNSATCASTGCSSTSPGRIPPPTASGSAR